MKEHIIDINCDMGESYGRFKIGNDEAIFPYITSCNIACGFHGGDPYTIEKTIDLALEKNMRIGAHPSYPDLSGFGRRKMNIPPHELKSIVKYQVSALYGIVESKGGRLKYVKPHGALYNEASINAEVAENIVSAILELNMELALMGKAGSQMEGISREKKMKFIPEAFADRIYEADGNLMSRNKKGAVITEPGRVTKQVLSIIKNNKVKTGNGEMISIRAESICVHGDNPAAVQILKAIDDSLKINGIKKRK